MKNSRLINSNIIRIVSRLGHGDMISVTDNGFPFPVNGKTEPIDLAVVQNQPRFLDIVEVLVSECYIERAIIADETRETNEDVYKKLLNVLEKSGPQGRTPEIICMPHENFKDLVLHGAERGEPILSMIRTGEFTPYSNVILVAGIPFC